MKEIRAGDMSPMVVDRLTLLTILINIEEVVSALPIDRAVRIKGRRVEDDRSGAVPGIVWSRRLNVLSFPVSLHYHGTSSSNCATSSE